MTIPSKVMVWLVILLGVVVTDSLSAPIGELIGKTLEIHLKDGKIYQGLVIAEAEDVIVIKGKLKESQEAVSEIQIPRSEITEIRLLPRDVIRDMLFWLGVAAVISGLVVMIFWGFR